MLSNYFQPLDGHKTHAFGGKGGRFSSDNNRYTSLRLPLKILRQGLPSSFQVHLSKFFLPSPLPSAAIREKGTSQGSALTPALLSLEN